MDFFSKLKTQNSKLRMAEREGFEPSERFRRSHDFQSGPFSLSGISPVNFGRLVNGGGGGIRTHSHYFFFPFKSSKLAFIFFAPGLLWG